MSTTFTPNRKQNPHPYRPGFIELVILGTILTLIVGFAR